MCIIRAIDKKVSWTNEVSAIRNQQVWIISIIDSKCAKKGWETILLKKSFGLIVQQLSTKIKCISP